MPDIFDIDRAFDVLADDVMHRASPPTAINAIKQARRRRRTALATAAAAALVVVAGFVVPTMVGEDDSSRVAENDKNEDVGRVRPLPAPAEFAPEGWEPLITGDTLFPHTSTCLRSFLEPGPEDRGLDIISELGRGDDRLVSRFFDFHDDEDSAERADQLVAATSSLTGCGAPTRVPRDADADVQHFASTEGGIATDLWVAQTAVDGPGLIGLKQRVGISLAVSKTPATSGEVAMIADSLVASLRDSSVSPGGSLRAYSKPALRAEEAEKKRLLEDARTAFGAWSRVWGGSDSPSFGLCAEPPLRGAPNPFLEGWIDYAVGAGGAVDIEFNVWRTDDEATTARAEFLSQLAECNVTQWQVESSGPSTWIATSHLGTAWIVQDAEAFGVLRAREAIDPPDDVSAAVFDVLTSTLVERPRP
ncbi:hypothetical protein [Nocardioides sp.]|uniref:hypothetical protein n=1 Tax=Nocardioides sp. TaxID=35761 RepID=UPI002BFB4A2B|nr:hypothetical protein [Nocardioides sp.]HXH80268.1 hypothetical protein [Nocardioides sp.]